ncbi:MAG TPA: type VII secretion protein EccB, partial [Pseudonocardiaceae bacterium]
LVLGTILGVAAAVLTAAVFGVLGLLNPSSSANWKQGGQVIVEQDNGARYILGKDGRLYPVLNYASARLLAAGNGTATATVSVDALSSVSRGSMLGIPGAPDSLPTGSAMADHLFTACSKTSPSQPANAEPTSTLILGSSADAGQQALGLGQGLLVSTADNQVFLIADGFRFRVPDSGTLAALHYDTIGQLPVALNWLGSVPAGPDLSLVDIAGSGSSGPDVGGQSTRIGQVLTDGEYYVVRSDGLEPVSQTEAYLITGDQHNANAYPNNQPAAIPTSVAAISATARSHQTGTVGLPGQLPRIVALGANPALCATGDGTSGSVVTAGAALPLPAGAQPINVAGSGQQANQVYVPPGSGVLVREQTGLTTNTGATYLVTDTGRKYLVPTQAAIASLGYGSLTPTDVAEPLLALLPDGPALDPNKAGIPVNEGGTG